MNCPNCQNDVVVEEKNFGALFTCPKCQAVYFIGFDGKAEYSDMADTPVLEDPYPLATQPDVPLSLESQSLYEIPEPEVELNSSPHSVSSESLVDFSVPMDPMLTNYENPMSAFSDSGDLSSAEQVNSPYGNQFADIAKDISDFGNSEVQISALNYDLEVSGLDSKEDLAAFKEALTDARFGWDVGDLMKQVRNGTVRFQKLSPVHAYVILKRIQFLNFELKWKQNVLE